MPTFTQVIADPEFTLVDAFIEARFPGVGRSMTPSWNNKVLSLEMDPAGITQVQFDQLIVDLTAAFPDAMAPENEFDTPFCLSDAAAMVWTAMPAALTEFRGLTVYRTLAHLGARTKGQIIVNVQTPGPAGSVLKMQCSLDNGVTWRGLEPAGQGTGPTVSIATAGVIRGPFSDIDVLVRKNVMLRLVGVGGNGTIAPSFGTTVMRVK